MRIKTFLTCGLVWTLAQPCMAAGTAGADPFNFLFLDANARSVGMGGAYTALANDANALLYNPAGLGKIDDYQATFMHNQSFAGINQEYMGFAAPRGWGANLNYLDFGTVQQTNYSNPNGTGLGTAGLTDMALSGGYGHRLTDNLSVGAAAKLIRETIAGIVGQSEAVDLGILYSVPAVDELSLGAALQNIGPDVRFQSDNEPLPVNARAGAAYGFKVARQQGTVSIDISKERTSAPVFAAGTELVLGGMVPVRLGYTTRNQSGPGVTLGVGFYYKKVAFDFAFVPFGNLGTASYLSATVHWGDGAASSGRFDNASDIRRN